MALRYSLLTPFGHTLATTRMNGSETLQNDEPTTTETALRRAVDTTPAFIHTARPDGASITLIGDGWILEVTRRRLWVALERSTNCSKRLS